MTTLSANGWTLIQESETKRYLIPEVEREIPLRNGYAGFVLAHLTFTFHKTIESLDFGGADDWGWAPRFISGQTVPSNHWSGTAVDLNSLVHPFGAQGTFKRAAQITKLQWMIGTKYQRMITWGGNWRNPDEMHFEINTTPQRIASLAKELRETPWGKLIREAND